MSKLRQIKFEESVDKMLNLYCKEKGMFIDDLINKLVKDFLPELERREEFNHKMSEFLNSLSEKEVKEMWNQKEDEEEDWF